MNDHPQDADLGHHHDLFTEQDVPDPDDDLSAGPQDHPDPETVPGSDAILIRSGEVADALSAVEDADERIATAYRENIAAYSQRTERPSMTTAIIGEVRAIGEAFQSKNLASPGNVFLRLMARAPTVQAYIRKRSAVVTDRISSVSGRLDRSMDEAVEDAREAAKIWGMHQNTITELTALIDVVRGYGSEIDMRIRVEGELRELIDSRREIDRVLDRIESRIFLLNQEADAIEAHVSRCREQVTALRDCRDYLAEMHHKIQIICLSANADRRSSLIADIQSNRERLEVMSSRLAKNAAITAAIDRERPVISTIGVKRIVRVRTSQDQIVGQIASRAENDRNTRRQAIAQGYRAGIGSSRDNAIARMHSQQEGS